MQIVTSPALPALASVAVFEWTTGGVVAARTAVALIHAQIALARLVIGACN